MAFSFEKLARSIKQAVRRFFDDYLRVFGASKSTALLLILSSGLIGVSVAWELAILGGFVDSMIGARGIGVWTSDLSKYLWQQAVLLVALAASVALVSKVSGLVRDLGLRTARACLISSLFITALSAAPIQLGVIVIAALVEIEVRQKIITLAFSILTILIALHSIINLTNLLINKVYSLGEGLMWGGALLVLAVYLSIRPFVRAKA